MRFRFITLLQHVRVPARKVLQYSTDGITWHDVPHVGVRNMGNKHT